MTASRTPSRVDGERKLQVAPLATSAVSITDAANARECAVAALVPPATMQHVAQIAGNLEKMPPKSTYFYPKLLSGLVFNPLTEPSPKAMLHTLLACRLPAAKMDRPRPCGVLLQFCPGGRFGLGQMP